MRDIDVIPPARRCSGDDDPDGEQVVQDRRHPQLGEQIEPGVGAVLRPATVSGMARMNEADMNRPKATRRPHAAFPRTVWRARRVPPTCAEASKPVIV
jgi:hypothetical protein